MDGPIGSRIVKIIRFSDLPEWAKFDIGKTNFPVDPMNPIDRTVGNDRLFIVGDEAVFNGKTVKGDDEPLFLQFEEE